MIPTKRPIPQKPRQTQHARPQPEAAEYDDMPDDGDRPRSKGWIWALCIVAVAAAGIGAYFLVQQGKNKNKEAYEAMYEEAKRIAEETIAEDVYPYGLEVEAEQPADSAVVADDGHCAGYDIDGNALPDYQDEEVVEVVCVDDYPPAEETPEAAGYESELDNKIFTSVEQMPRFPGGEEELMKYISDNIKYPAVAMENNVQGRVVVQFVVTRDGSIGEVKVARGKDPDLDREAVRVVKTLPKFIPGKMNGQAVNVWYTLPITFKLQG